MNAVLELLQHPAMFTVEDEKKYYPDGLEGATTKNLFLRNKKGDRHYLVTIEGHKRADLQKLAEMLGEAGLSFASPDRMMKCLGLTPGSVSLFGLMNDKAHEVVVVMDEELLDAELINCHPN